MPIPRDKYAGKKQYICKIGKYFVNFRWNGRKYYMQQIFPSAIVNKRIADGADKPDIVDLPFRFSDRLVKEMLDRWDVYKNTEEGLSIIKPTNYKEPQKKNVRSLFKRKGEK